MRKSSSPFRRNRAEKGKRSLLSCRAAYERRSLPSGRLGAFLTTSRREVPPGGRPAEATRAKPSLERRSLPSGRLGAFLTTSRRELPPEGRPAEAARAKLSLRGGRWTAYGSTARRKGNRGLIQRNRGEKERRAGLSRFFFLRKLGFMLDIRKRG